MTFPERVLRFVVVVPLVLALAAFVYIVGAALSKSAASWLVWWGQI